MRRIFAVIALLGVMMMCFTGCGEKDFDGKWDCVEAEVDTYGGALTGAYNAIEQNGGVSLLCEVKIDGDDVTYSENAREYKVSDVQRSGKTITFTVTGSYGVKDTVTLKLKDEGKTIIATRDENIYTLERADLFHKVFAQLPIWVYLILGGFLLLVIIGKILAAKDKAKRKAPQAAGQSIQQQMFGSAPQQRPVQQPVQNPVQQPVQRPVQPQQPNQPYYDPENPFQNQNR
ncbi:MAG: hypothetical protein IJM44_02010 [Ruminococcus sp.]|nr:hypothetical protein [Ruminococcus sp.]